MPISPTIFLDKNFFTIFQVTNKVENVVIISYGQQIQSNVPHKTGEY